jgi:hypothetical protein
MEKPDARTTVCALRDLKEENHPKKSREQLFSGYNSYDLGRLSNCEPLMRNVRKLRGEVQIKGLPGRDFHTNSDGSQSPKIPHKSC